LNSVVYHRTANLPLAKATSLILVLICFLFALPVEGQNTKGDRPVGNQRQVKETKSKSYKRKERGSTKDIAGRRLRARGRSSASRANAQHRQPPTTKRRPERYEERPAPPRGRVFSRAPRESRVRAWKGDVSGYPMKRVKPSGHDAARSNVYPQKGLYVRYAQRKPKERPPVYKRTIKGKRFVEHKPREQERAWTGGLEHGPLRNQSATGTIKNTYSQSGPYVSYYHRRSSKKTRSYSNRSQVSRVQRYSRAPRTGGSQPVYYPASATRPYVQRGRKNVYWGKYQKKERPVTTDLTGGPVRTRNYKSPPIGLVGRDTLVYFNRKPSEDRGRKPPTSGYRTTGRASRGWKGDVAGWPVRSPRAQRDRYQQPLAPTQPGIGALWIKKVFNRSFRGVRPKDRIPSTAEARYSGDILLADKTKGFSDGGSGYSGNMPRGKGFTKTAQGHMIKSGPVGFSRDGAGYSGNIRRKGKPVYSRSFLRYSGHMPRSALSEFNPSMYGYSGYIKRNEVRPFSPQGANYSGNLRRVRGFGTEYAGYSGNLPKSAAAKQFEEVGFEYQGFIKQKSANRARIDGIGKKKYRYPEGFTFDGAGFAGRERAKRPAKGGGSISGMWNNDESPLAKTPPISAGGADFSGRTKAKRPSRGGGSVSGILWNNEQSPLGKNLPVSMAGANFSGRTKAKRPLKGGGSVSFKLWNNQETALAKNPPVNLGGVEYSGRTKAKRPEKGGGSVSGIIWNNAGKALAKSPPPTAGAPAGLYVRVKEKNYTRKKHASRNAMPGIAPTGATVKASEYSRNMKLYWNYKHNPNSSRDALRTIGPNKAEARLRDYQGNTRMHKYSVSGKHPDAKFAHGEDDNVKGERGLLTSVKLFWEKMFNKNATQPANVKDKNKKIQYDKREKGLWAY